MTLRRRCLCGCGQLVTGSRCEASRQAQRAKHRGKYADGWTRISREYREQWVAQHGWTCPGDEYHRAHPCTDLTVDHRGQGLAVICRAGNTARRNRGHDA